MTGSAWAFGDRAPSRMRLFLQADAAAAVSQRAFGLDIESPQIASRLAYGGDPVAKRSLNSTSPDFP